MASDPPQGNPKVHWHCAFCLTPWAWSTGRCCRALAIVEGDGEMPTLHMFVLGDKELDQKDENRLMDLRMLVLKACVTDASVMNIIFALRRLQLYATTTLEATGRRHR